MPQVITLDVSHPTCAPGPISGFRFLWAMYVNGRRADRHCQPGLKGRRVPEFNTATARSGVTLSFDRMAAYPFLYICGVGSGRVRDPRATNLHLVLQFSAGDMVQATSYNGYRFMLQNARQVAIPPLPRGWRGLPTPSRSVATFSSVRRPLVAVLQWTGRASVPGTPRTWRLQRGRLDAVRGAITTPSGSDSRTSHTDSTQ